LSGSSAAAWTPTRFNAAFVLPDMISYFLVGGAASITFVTILTRYRESGREAEGERSLSVILTTMYLVLGGPLCWPRSSPRWYIHWWFSGFDAEKAALCVKLTRILLPAQLCFFAGGVFGAVLLVRKQFNVQAFAAYLQPGHHRGRRAAGASAWASLRWPSARWREPSSGRFC
jgi:putative peptidoglycan lipid II flippase